MLGSTWLLLKLLSEVSCASSSFFAVNQSFLEVCFLYGFLRDQALGSRKVRVKHDYIK